MSKKIDINPSLFNFDNLSKTKKNHGKKNKNNLSKIPLISPNILKNKLLNRIKEHKKKENSEISDNKSKLTNEKTLNKDSLKSYSTDDINVDINKYTDEFNESIDYLQNLSLKKEQNEKKKLFEKQKQKKLDDLERKTLKNYDLYSNPNFTSNSQMPYVNLDLPDSLQDQFINNQIEVNTPALVLNKKHDSVPYGVLKGGIKPTYREWQRTQKNNVVDNPKLALVPTNTNNIISEREMRLNRLKQKIRMKQIHKAESYKNANQISINPAIKNINNKTDILGNNIIDSNNSISNSINIDINKSNENLEDALLSDNLIITNKNNDVINQKNILINDFDKLNDINQNNDSYNSLDNEKSIKKITKKTIKRKYIVGKSLSNNRVSILIKNKQTKKNIIDAQKNLKKKSINDIKKYLRDHNIIKIGSNAPNDIVRKMYESAMLAGEITNINKDTLLHNFMKDDENI